MGPIASAAARSGIMAIVVFVLFVAASIVLMNAPLEFGLRALQRSFIDGPMLIAAAIGCLAFSGWLWFDKRKPSRSPRSHLVSTCWAILATLLISVGIVVLCERTSRLFGNFWYMGRFPWHYWLRLFEAALFAVALARIALPLLPRFDKMPPHKV